MREPDFGINNKFLHLFYLMPNGGDSEAIGDFIMKSFKFIGMVLFAIFMCANFTSCNGREKRAELARQQAVADSLRIAREKIEAERAAEKARIEKERIEAEALTAWGDAKFGMTPKEVKATNAFKNSEKYVKGTIMSDGRRSRSYISFTYKEKRNFEDNMGLESIINDFYAEFESEELTRIHWECYGQSANYINDIVTDAQILSYRFTQKYGKPKIEKSSVSILDFDRGREFTYAKWQIGDKTAVIFMGESRDGYEYYYRVVIYNSKFPTKPDVEEQEAIKKYEEKKKKESANYF